MKWLEHFPEIAVDDDPLGRYRMPQPTPELRSASGLFGLSPVQILLNWVERIALSDVYERTLGGILFNFDVVLIGRELTG
ncbi:hypothetical protein OMCYN_01716 [cyanobiont of Ornithocercus magnificus]|nr:hypothetical protein OMCYN_01716 [cyanobiont of Ornithocercus magnificus]